MLTPDKGRQNSLGRRSARQSAHCQPGFCRQCTHRCRLEERLCKIHPGHAQDHRCKCNKAVRGRCYSGRVRVQRRRTSIPTHQPRPWQGWHPKVPHPCQISSQRSRQHGRLSLYRPRRGAMGGSGPVRQRHKEPLCARRSTAHHWKILPEVPSRRCR